MRGPVPTPSVLASSVPAPTLPTSPVPASPAMVPARLQTGAGGTGAAPQCLAQIEDFAALHSGNRVILGPAAFADGDELVLVRLPRRGPDGLPMDGRAAPPQPVVLKLLSGPQGCFVRLADAPSPGAALPACACSGLSGN